MKEMPEAERPREKLFSMGAKSLSNTELLAVLLRSGQKGASAMTLAENLLSADPSGLLFLGDCTPQELCQIDGVGVAKASVLAAAVELGRRITSAPRDKRVDVSSPDKAAALFMEEMRYLHQEHFRVLMLNVKNEIIMTEEISVGSINSSEAHPRDVFTAPIRKGAANIILIHNHPSGNPSPSHSDILLTERLVMAGQLLGIGVLDHIIIGDGKFVSLRHEGLMDQ